jgi:hypothetical protein
MQNLQDNKNDISISFPLHKYVTNNEWYVNHANTLKKYKYIEVVSSLL